MDVLQHKQMVWLPLDDSHADFFPLPRNCLVVSTKEIRQGSRYCITKVLAKVIDVAAVKYFPVPKPTYMFTYHKRSSMHPVV